MARIRFKKPKVAVLISEIISLTVWLYLGDEIINTLDTLVGDTQTLAIAGSNTSVDGCTNATVFGDSFEIMGIGYDCSDGSQHTSVGNVEALSNTDDGLLGVIGLVLVIMVLMNFISYN